MITALDHWIGRQYRDSAAGMLASVSRSDLVRTRTGRPIRPHRGSIVASPAPGAYDPDPDYFFHWYRDAALVVDALRLLHLDGACGARCAAGATGTNGAAAAVAVTSRPDLVAAFADFVRFSATLGALDGRALADGPGWRADVPATMLPHLRPDTELAAVRGDAVAAEARVNPDGTLDVLHWARPQHDGPALRALALLRWMHDVPLPAAVAADAAALVRDDLGYTARHALQDGYGLWEEDQGLHYYTLSVAAAALQDGADWLARQGAQSLAREYRSLGDALLTTLDGYWLEAAGFYCSRAPAAAAAHARDPDIAIILAALHAGRRDGAHSVHDGRVQATLARLDALFAAGYAINRNRPPARGPALGRYRDDRYYAGGAYFFATLAAAELCYRTGQAGRGDAYLETVRAYAPANGELAEQFDQRSGQPASARPLAWSHAAYIGCIAARRLLA